MRFHLSHDVGITGFAPCWLPLFCSIFLLVCLFQGFPVYVSAQAVDDSVKLTVLAKPVCLGDRTRLHVLEYKASSPRFRWQIRSAAGVGFIDTDIPTEYSWTDFHAQAEGSVVIRVSVEDGETVVGGGETDFKVIECNCSDNLRVITQPTDGQVVSDELVIIGTAAIDDFSFYQVEYAPGTTDTAKEWTWPTKSDVNRKPVINGELGRLPLQDLEDGLYTLRLRVKDRETENHGNECKVEFQVQQKPDSTGSEGDASENFGLDNLATVGDASTQLQAVLVESNDASTTCPADSRGIIDIPARDAPVKGMLSIIGRVQHDFFGYYQLDIFYLDEMNAEGKPRVDWITNVSKTKTGELYQLDTTKYSDGPYVLRLRVVDQFGNWPPECHVPFKIENNAPQPTPVDTPVVPVETVSPPPVATGPTVSSLANIRSGPGIEYEIVGSAAEGEGLTITGRNAQNTWYRLTNDRWISAGLVFNPPAANEIPVIDTVLILVPTPEPTTAPVAVPTVELVEPATATPLPSTPTDTDEVTPTLTFAERIYKDDALGFAKRYETAVLFLKQQVESVQSGTLSLQDDALLRALSNISRQLKAINKDVIGVDAPPKFANAHNDFVLAASYFGVIADQLEVAAAEQSNEKLMAAVERLIVAEINIANAASRLASTPP